MPKDDTDDIIDPRMREAEVARHLERCPRCREGLARARALGPAAIAGWRREFARCVARRPA
jgi:anti-sigma factor RsiW